MGAKNYGSIPHLPNSRMGPADHACHSGQARIATEKKRDKHDEIIVQEKVDGSNVGVGRIGDTLYPIGRAGWLAISSPYEQHRLFANWVYENYSRFMDLLQGGERLVGEWLAQAHSTRYRLHHEPFVALDIMTGTTRLPYDEFLSRAEGFVMPHLIHRGDPLSAQAAMDALGTYGFHGALDPVEGVVWRVQRNGKVDFLVKYVRPDKRDGGYLPEISGRAPIWNWQPTL